MGCVRHVGHAARSREVAKSQWLLGLEYDKLSLHVKRNNGRHPYLTVNAKRTKHKQPPKKPLGLTLGFHGRDCNYIIHQFIHKIFSKWIVDVHSNIVFFLKQNVMQFHSHWFPILSELAKWQLGAAVYTKYNEGVCLLFLFSIDSSWVCIANLFIYFINWCCHGYYYLFIYS